MTQREREILIDVIGPTMSVIGMARSILYDCWETYFGYAKQRSISEYEAGRIGRQLYIIDRILLDCLTDYTLDTGDNTDSRADILRHLHREQDLTLQVAGLHDKIIDALEGKPCNHHLRQKQEELANLDDAEAIPRLRELLDEIMGIA